MPGKVALLIGTRPEAIKLMPVVRALERAGHPPYVFATGQHRDLLQPILRELGIAPLENLDLMTSNQSLGELSVRILAGVQVLLRKYTPEILLLQGDTTSVAMGALACFYEDVRVGHVEAGLRTHNRRNPYPEEMNRRLAGCMADVHFAPTEPARQNLLREGVDPQTVHVVGNTVIDALFLARDQLVPSLAPDPELERQLDSGKDLILMTGHRRESFGPDFYAICDGVRRLAREHAGRVQILYPVHPNPNVRSVVEKELTGIGNVILTEPLSYLRFIQIMLRARMIITDSGGVQEEAAALGIPVLVTRRTCERLEAVEAGVSQLVGPDADAILAAASELLLDEKTYHRRARPTSVFGDGRAADRIVNILLEMMR
jgi:UDP-N-acetylglucosamine 2-epimerase (non-hydrolysing)